MSIILLLFQIFSGVQIQGVVIETGTTLTTTCASAVDTQWAADDWIIDPYEETATSTQSGDGCNLSAGQAAF